MRTRSAAVDAVVQIRDSPDHAVLTEEESVEMGGQAVAAPCNGIESKTH
jgi:hypothetical protein